MFPLTRGSLKATYYETQHLISGCIFFSTRNTTEVSSSYMLAKKQSCPCDAVAANFINSLFSISLHFEGEGHRPVGELFPVKQKVKSTTKKHLTLLMWQRQKTASWNQNYCSDCNSFIVHQIYWCADYMGGKTPKCTEELLCVLYVFWL